MLTIYRASAGAGKTHRLTGEYLLLLFSQPGAYRRILAVTFTNKATDEMKGRIVEELFNLSAGHKSDYVELLSGRYGLDEAQVRSQARKILIAILHDYSAFNISTIDRFFQQTMRAFTREIGLQGGYGIEMDQDLVLSEAVDRLLGDLDKSGNKELLGWLLRFAEDKIEDGGEWNLRRDIKMLGKELFKESYKQFSDALSEDIADKKALENYKETLFGIIRTVEKEVKTFGEKANAIMKEYGLQPSDFIQGSRSPMFLFQRWATGEMKEPTATFRNLADNVEKWYTKKTDPALQAIIGTAYDNGLNDCIKGIIAKLYSEGLINKNFGYGFELYPGCALMAAGGESRDPRAVRDAVLAEGERLAREGIDEGLFRRLKKGVFGAKVRGLNSFENVCIELAQAHFSGVEYLTFPEVFDGISKADVEDCIRRWVTGERCGLAVVRPGETV